MKQARAALARPAVVVIIRHGEKNVDANGEEIEGDSGLREEGTKRAQALSAYFEAGSQVAKTIEKLAGVKLDNDRCIFDAIYTMKQAKPGRSGKAHSDRPRLTVLPYASKMIAEKKLDNASFYRFGGRGGTEDGDKKTAFGKGEETELVQDINHNYANKRVLICWEHKAIKEIIEAWFYAGPFKWGPVYNRTLFVTFDEFGKAIPALELAQHFGLPDDKPFLPVTADGESRVMAEAAVTFPAKVL